MDLPVAEFRIDVAHHLKHRASLHLRRLGVERAVRLVAVVAASLVLDAQRGRKRLHLSREVLRRQHFEILGRTILSPAIALGVQRSLRRHEHDGADNSQCGAW